jgi:DNA invertase Pin-like site-specific DNA recombinase
LSSKVHIDGKNADRAQLRRVIDQLDAGDVVMVTRLDRLARSTRDLLNTLAAIADAKPAFDRSTMHGPTPPRRTTG